MLRLIRKLIGQNTYPLNKIQISGQTLINNYQILSKINPNVEIAPVLKSNAYGHGIELVGKLLDSQNPPFICVDSFFEAMQLKGAGVKTPILIMGYTDPRNLKVRKFPFQYAVFDLDFAKALNGSQKGAKVHIFVGTGMSREGVLLRQLPGFLKAIKQFNNLKVEGLMSHFASADNPKNDQNQTQLKNFKLAKEICLENGITPKWFHLGGTYALLNGLEDGCNLIRAGRALYGLVPSVNSLKPALSLYSKIVQIKNITKNAKVGYGGTFSAKKDMTIGILPIGYNDGVDRRLSNKGLVLVDGVECPIIGLISMNITTIDISKVKNPFVGQEVMVFSEKREDPNSIEKAANLCKTIPHDLLVHLNPLAIKREIF